MIFLVVFSALLFWACVFTVFFATQGTTPAEFLFGRYEPLAPDLGSWRELGFDEERRMLKEERLLLAPGRPGAGYLLRQVRYRDPTTRAIEYVEPEQRVRRLRVGNRAARE